MALSFKDLKDVEFDKVNKNLKGYEVIEIPLDYKINKKWSEGKALKAMEEEGAITSMSKELHKELHDVVQSSMNTEAAKQGLSSQPAPNKYWTSPPSMPVQPVGSGGIGSGYLIPALLQQSIKERLLSQRQDILDRLLKLDIALEILDNNQNIEPLINKLRNLGAL